MNVSSSKSSPSSWSSYNLIASADVSLGPMNKIGKKDEVYKRQTRRYQIESDY